MKKVTVKHKKSGDTLELWRIESILEIGYIETCLQLYCDSIIRSCVNSGEPYYRYNHVYGHFKGISKALTTFIYNLPFSDSGLTGMKISVNPLLKLDEANRKYIETLTKTYVKNQTAFISVDFGGVSSPIVYGDYDITDETDVEGLDDVGKLKIDNFQKSIYFR